MYILPILTANYSYDESLILNICDAIEIYHSYLEVNKEILLKENVSINYELYDSLHKISLDYFMTETLFDWGDFEDGEFEENYNLEEDIARVKLQQEFPFYYTIHLDQINNSKIPIKGDLMERCYKEILSLEHKEIPDDFFKFGFDEYQIARYLEAFGFSILDNVITKTSK